MKYIELTVHTTSEASELISDIMWNYTDYGVTICDRADIIALQTAKESTFWDYMDDDLTADKPSDVLVKCYVATDVSDEVLPAILHDVFDAKERSEGCIPFGMNLVTVKSQKLAAAECSDTYTLREIPLI